MTEKKSNLRRAQTACRSFGLHARFTADGPEPSDANAFREFYREVKVRAQTLKAKALRERGVRLNAFIKAAQKARPILRKLMRDEISPDEAGRSLRRLIPDKTIAAEVIEHWSVAVKATPEAVTDSGKDIEREEAALSRRKRLLRTDQSLHRCLSWLAEAAMSGDIDAAKDLVDAATSAADLLKLAEEAQPAVFAGIARSRMQWPVVATEEAGWEKIAAQRIASLNLGVDLEVFKVRFRHARGADANLPARLWAKAAVRVAEETRLRLFMIGQVHRDFGSSGMLADFCLESGWELRHNSKWGDKGAILPPLSQATLSKWKPVVRDMIREEMPKFHERAEWINQRRTAAVSGRDSVGEIQNAILDDIISALGRLAQAQLC